ncbi:MAG: zinc ABC transporter solute-binding protein [Chloroflexi bacterium]|nr:zinc ABC transporter solute-binding protein [Chloroflexota bacterium]
MLRKHLVVLSVLVALVIAPVLSSVVPSPAAAQSGERLRVVASFSILADVASNVAGDAADVESLMPVGTNPHTYAPSAQDVILLDEADMVLVVGINFEEGLLEVVEEAAGDKLVVVSSCVPVRPVFGEDMEDEDEDEEEEAEDNEAFVALCDGHYATVEAAFGMPVMMEGSEYLGPLYATHCAEHGDEDEDEGEEGEEGEEHHHAGCDPHVWMDPINVALWTLLVRDELSALDPANADIYAANAEAYLAELAVLDADVRAILDAVPDGNRFVVTNHLAFNYFTERYGLTLVGTVIPGASTTAEPSIDEVITLIETITDYDVPAIFTSLTVSDSLAREIADETGAEIASLYTGSLTNADGPADTYINYTIANATNMAEALQ